MYLYLRVPVPPDYTSLRLGNVRLLRKVQDGCFFIQGSRKNVIFVGNEGTTERTAFSRLSENSGVEFGTEWRM